MELILEENIREKTVRTVAEKMMIAARTAPKARGVDQLVIAIAEKELIKKIADKMKEMVEKNGAPQFFIRDANNILIAELLFLIGTKIKVFNLNPCGMCGFANCEEKEKYPSVPCAFNTGDLGIAIGSAVSIAANERVDNRIMYSVGQAVLEMKLLGDDVKIAYGIPLSVSSKSPFFDRK
ncbi:MAG: DUF2148 domain-containing protein [Ignavibacteria bacterium]|nr:DUF2148 domain-containing protein [Ignavibacteria bacterium]